MTPAAPPIIGGLSPILITGGAGFIGANLADRLACEGEHVLLLDSLARPGVERNVAWLRARHPSKISLIAADVRDAQASADAAREASAVFHFAAQVAVTTSLVDPREDFSINVAGTLGLLESLRARAAHTPFIFASTNKVYGDLANVPVELKDGAYRPVDELLARRGISETQPLDFHTPYGCSKGAAEQYVLDYARSYGLPTAVMRMSCIYGPRQMGTEDQGWVAHFLLKIAAGESVAIYGDGHQVRDILFVDDAVDAYVEAWRRIGRIAGRAFNLGGGPANAVTVRDVVARAETLFNRKVAVEFEPWRAGDQRYYVSDTRQVRVALGLAAPLGWREGMARLADWITSQGHTGLSTPAALQQVGT
jgi:CDP-paratose 2-epimerase